MKHPDTAFGTPRAMPSPWSGGGIMAALMALAFIWQDTEIIQDGIRVSHIRLYLIMPLVSERAAQPLAG